MVKVERRKSDTGFKAQRDALLDATVDAIILIDVAGRITLFNHAAERLFGYAADEVVGQNVSCLMPEPYHGEHDGYIARYRKTGEARIIGIGREVTARRKDGSIFPIELSVGEVKYQQQQQQQQHGFVGIIRDISQQNEIKQRLRQQAEELRLIFEAAPSAIAIVAPDQRLVNANRAWFELLGYSEQHLAALTCNDILHPEDYAVFAALLERLQTGDQDLGRTTVRLVSRTGGTLHALVQVGVIRDEKGLSALIVEMIDRTAQALAEREATELRENLAHITRLSTLGEMATGIAHELNQPLTAIATYAQASRRLIASGAGELPEIIETLEKIAAQAERAGEVIRRLRAMLVRREAQREPVACDLLINDIVKLAELDLRDRNISFHVQVNDALPAVSVDKVQIQQVIINLLRNAMEAMAETASGSQITLAAGLADDNMLEIAVSDSGPGVSDSAAPKLFDAFYTTKSQGLGMGLAICRSIARAHGGELVFSNNRYGGATFRLRLPALSQEVQP